MNFHYFIDFYIIEINEHDSIKQQVKAVEGAKVRIFIIKIFEICTTFPTKSTMLITNMKEFL